MSRFSVKKRLKSFQYAFNGIKLLFKHEHNSWIHATVALVVILFGIWLHLSRTECLFIVFAIGLVIIAEGVNTALEYLADAITIEHNEKIKKAKDIGAGAVLIAAITAAVIGLFIFIPHLIEKIS